MSVAVDGSSVASPFWCRNRLVRAFGLVAGGHFATNAWKVTVHTVPCPRITRPKMPKGRLGHMFATLLSRRVNRSVWPGSERLMDRAFGIVAPRASVYKAHSVSLSCSSHLLLQQLLQTCLSLALPPRTLFSLPVPADGSVEWSVQRSLARLNRPR